VTMRVWVTTQPMTADEAALAVRIHEAVEGLIQDAGGVRDHVLRTRTLYEHRRQDGWVEVVVGELNMTASHSVHIDGPPIPKPSVIPQEFPHQETRIV